MNNELYHYGVPGMKWGTRKASGPAGSGKRRYLTKKRQLVADKRTLNALNNGQHLRTGFTKKRQEKYDKKDRMALEKRISKAETKKTKDRGRRKVALMLAGAGAGAGIAFAASRPLMRVGKKYVDSYFNNAVLDAEGNVIKRWH